MVWSDCWRASNAAFETIRALSMFHLSRAVQANNKAMKVLQKVLSSSGDFWETCYWRDVLPETAHPFSALHVSFRRWKDRCLDDEYAEQPRR